MVHGKSNAMKAVRLHRRGGPDALVYEDAPRPALLDDDALVRVRAVGITGTELSWGTTYAASDGTPRLPSIPGHEISGVVEALGVHTAGLRAGSAVFGLTDFYRDGGEAELVAVRARDLAIKPRSLDFVHAAAVTLSGLTAWQALFDHGRLAAGQRVLIHGAAGGVGTFAVQLAARRGAHVIGTASAKNDRLLRELGADEVIDYTAARFEDLVHDVDLVLDTIGGDTLDRSWGVLRKGGTLVTIAGAGNPKKAKRFGVRSLFFVVEPNRQQLMEIGRWIDAGTLRVVVEAVFPLEQARMAFEKSLQGHNRGKIVLRVPENG